MRDHVWSKDNSVEIEKGWITAAPTVPELAGKLEDEARDPTDYHGRLQRLSATRRKTLNSIDRRIPSVRLDKPLFAAVKLFPMMYNTQGGPKRNGSCQVVDPFDQPIPRLYSAGDLGSFWGWMYNGGGNLSECMATGRIAGRNLAAAKPWK